MTKKKLVYGGLSLTILIAAFIFSGYLINAKPVPRKDSHLQNNRFVKVEKVAPVHTESEIYRRGRVTPYDNISLAAEVQGKIMQGNVRFKAGETFNKNEVLVHIYKKDVEASIKSGKSSFLQTLSKILPDLKIDFPEEHEKWNAYFNSIDVEQILPELPRINSNKEKVFLAANNVLASYYSLQQQEINLSRYTIYAPFNGIFTSVNKEIGAIASPGVELATIIRSDKLELVVPVFPADLQWLQQGDKVAISLSNGSKSEATISRISGFVDESTQSVNVYLTYFNNGKNNLLPGEYVDAIFKGIQVSGFEIPREAIVDGSYVYELHNKKLSKIPVKILRQLDDAYIISGLESGKTIVTESLASVSDNVEYLAR